MHTPRMSDPNLLDLIDSNTPKLNPVICNGLATQHLRQAEDYINDIIRDVSKEFPPGLLYLGCERCPPGEEFDEVTRLKNSKRTFDIARSDLFLMKYKFSFQGEEMKPRYIFLPYVGEGGSLVLSGTRYILSPVLTDKVISVGITEVFVRLLRAKLRFHRTAHNYFINGVRETIQVVHSEVYNKSAKMQKMKSPVKAVTCMMHYLLAKYGFYETFKQFANCRPIVGTVTNINEITHPSSEWVICTSLSIPPKGAAKTYYYPSQLAIAFRKEDFTLKVKSMMAGFFYVVDYFPDRISVEYIDHIRVWKTLLGLILWSDQISEGKLVEDVSKHLASLDDYIDNLNKLELKDIGYDCTNIYTLFGIIIENLTDWLLNASDEINSMNGKTLSVVYDTIYHVTKSIFETHFKLKAVTKKQLTAKDIKTIFDSTLKVRGIYGITKQHKGVSTISYSGDNKFFKVTSVLVPQSSGGSNKRKERTSIEDPMLKAHSSIPEVGSYLFLPKSDPSGHARINPHLLISEKGVVLRNKQHINLIDDVQAKIKTVQ